MTSAENLHRTVQQTLASKRVGTPVFVRYFVQNRDEANAVVPRLARMTKSVREWFAQPIARMYALGAVKDGQVTLTIEFEQGATALLSWASGTPRGDGIDLMLLGNHGAIYHDAGTAYLWDQAATPPADEPDKEILAQIERALRG